MIFATVSSLPKMIILKLSDFHLSKRLKPWIICSILHWLLLRHC
jgi:hypothetical protein